MTAPAPIDWRQFGANPEPSAVANLQQALLLLFERNLISASDTPTSIAEPELTDIATNIRLEMGRSIYGPNTLRAVCLLQTQQRLSRGATSSIVPTLCGRLDEETARHIDKLVHGPDGGRRWYLRRCWWWWRWCVGNGDNGNPGKPQSHCVVRGAVTDISGVPLPGLYVRVFDRDLRTEQLLGTWTTDVEGRYSVAYTPFCFEQGDSGSADLIVRAYASSADDATMLAESGIVFNAPSEAEVDLVVSARGVGSLSEFERCTAMALPLLKGQGNDGADLPPGSLDAKDIEFISREAGLDPVSVRSWSQAHSIAETFELLTDSAVPYEAPGAPSANALEAIIFYAWLRQGMPIDPAALLAVHDSLLRDALERSSRDRLVPTLSSSLLDLVMEQVRAARQASAQLPAGENQPPSLGDLLGTAFPPDGSAPAGTAAAIASAFATHVGSLDVLRAGPRDAVSFDTVARSGALAGFWSALDTAGVGAPAVARVRLAFDLDELTLGHLPLVRALLSDAANEPGLADVRGLARYDLDEWRAILLRPRDLSGNPIGAPSNAGGVDAYAARLEATVKQAFPTAVIANRIERDLDEASPFAGTRVDLITFFANNPDFALGVHPLTAYLATDSEVKLSGVDDPSALAVKVKEMERLTRFSTDFKVIRALLADGIDSAMHVLRVGPEVFSQRYGSLFGSVSLAREAHDRAGTAVLGAISLYLRFGWEANAPLPYVLTDPATGEGATTSAGTVDISAFSDADRATWATLFGSGDLALCACKHCASVLSPAAYLVDSLSFLGRNSSPGTESPLQVLLRRRPDLAHIELTCDNTDVEVLTIDLVDEILSRAVSGGDSIAIEGTFTMAALDAGTIDPAIRLALGLSGSATLSADIAGSRWILRDVGWRYVLTPDDNGLRAYPYPQTTGPSEERAAVPQHRDPTSTRMLAGKAYPWSLPLHLPLETTRGYLKLAGAERRRLLAVARPVDAARATASERAAALETIGMNPLEAAIVVGEVLGDPRGGSTSANEPWSFWGFWSEDVNIPDPDTSGPPRVNIRGPWHEALKRVAVWLAQSRQSYAELLQWLDTRHLNPASGSGRKLSIRSIDVQLPATCDPAKLEIHGLDATALERMHRFGRLQRRLGWAARDLDRAIAAFGVSDLSAAFLVQLDGVLQTMERTKLPVAQTLALWSNIDSFTYLVSNATDRGGQAPRSLYETLFREPSQGVPLDPAFVEDAGALAGSALSSHQPTLLAALRIGAEDLTRLLTRPGAVAGTDDVLTLANLSALFRHAALARALRLSVRDLLQAGTLFGETPFGGGPERTLRFIDRITAVRAAGLDVPTLAFILRNDDGAGGPQGRYAEETSRLSSLLFALRTGLAKIAAETAALGATIDSDGSVTSEVLEQLQWNPVHEQQFVRLLGDGTTHAVDLAALPAGWSVPAGLEPRISFDGLAGKLRFRGVMSNAALAALKGAVPAATPASTSQLYISAVEELHSVSRSEAKEFIERWCRACTLPEFIAPAGSTRLASPVALPVAFATRLRYEAASGKLVARGALSDDDVAVLLGLSTDADYIAAVRSLSAQARAYVPAPANRFLLDPDVADPTAASLTALFDTAETAVERYELVLDRLTIHLRRTRSEAFVSQAFSAAWRLPADLVQRLLADLLVPLTNPPRSAMDDLLAPTFVDSSGPIEGAGYAAQYAVARRMSRIAVLAGHFDLTAEALSFMASVQPTAGWYALYSLPVGAPAAGGVAAISYAEWEKWVTAIGLQQDNPDAPDLLTLLRWPNDAARTKSEFMTEWCRRTGTATTDLEVLMGQAASVADTGLFGFAWPAGWRDGSAFVRLRDCLDLMQKLGIAGRSLSRLVQIDASTETADAIWNRALDNATTARSAAKAGHEATAWLAIEKPIEDRLREMRRPALVDALAGSGDVGHDANDLYDYYLVDVEMCACMSTTRIRQALSSVQLFVQRCLLNLEPEATLQPEQAAEWSRWRSLYRVWEANWKVLLQPENWIDPTLRDDMTSPFEKARQALMQDELTPGNIEEAVRGYLDELHRIARLEIAALCQQPAVAGASATLHVFGRTRGIPHLYYYRTLQGGVWTPWERLDLDIEGDHLVPAWRNGRLILAWPLFNRQSLPADRQKPVGNTYPKEEWHIKLAWSERRHGRWQPKRVSTEPLRVPIDVSPQVPQSPRDFKFLVGKQPRDLGSSLAVLCYGTLVHRPPPVTAPPPPPAPQPLPDRALHRVVFNDNELVKLVLVTFTFRMASRNLTLQEAALVKVIRTDLASGRDTVLPPPVWTVFSPPWHVITGANANAAFRMTQADFVVESVAAPRKDVVVWVIDVTLAPKVHAATPVPGGGGSTDEVQSTPPYRRHHALGEFVLDDCSHDAWPVEAALVAPAIAPTELQPIPTGQAHFDAMATVENDNRFYPFDPFGSGTVMLQATPDVYRVMLRPEGFNPTSLTLPFSYQDPDRSYLVEMVTAEGGHWGGRKLRFQALHHPLACVFIEALERGGVPALLDSTMQSRTDNGRTFMEAYKPRSATVYLDLDTRGTVVPRTPHEMVDFSRGGACSQYNWELFFHLPWLIATRLSANQRFEDARRWYHYIFDPTTSRPGGRERFWNFKPFRDEASRAPQSIEDLMRSESEALQEQMAEWSAHPFQPFAIARLRTPAFMKAVVIGYVSNLVDWGDHLFQRDTIEAIDEATLLYVMAARLLGPRPEDVPARARPEVQTFDSLARHGRTDILGALVEIESFVPPSTSPTGGTLTTGLGSLGTMPLFCLPRNETMRALWDKVADRLFNIRHCRNIGGTVRRLPVWDPPIDPRLLVQAAAAGVDLSSVLNDLSAPLPQYRFAAMLQKAHELCGEAKALGAALQSALEKRDVEHLAALRSGHEVALLNAVRAIRQQQVEEAVQAQEGLKANREVVVARQEFFSSRPYTNEHEQIQMQLSNLALMPLSVQLELEIFSAIMHLIPETKAGAPTTLGVTYGGSNIAGALEGTSRSLGAAASLLNSGASMAGTLGSYDRRSDEWAHQADLATKELKQIDAQIAAADVRHAIALNDLANHDLQIANAKEADAFMREKFSRTALFDWMAGQVAQVYFQTYRLAHSMAKRAERSKNFEMGSEGSHFISFGYWDSLKRGLLAAEMLQFDLRRLESDWIDRNRREFEITRHVSLSGLDPMALVRLRETGTCEFEIPEALFDLEHPGHYMRRIKYVSLSIPCVTGPYAGVPCQLTLLRSTVRRDPSPDPDYERGDPAAEDTRFVDYFGNVQSIVTSQAQNDSGMFETNLREERYLPFEGMGAAGSRWRLELPAAFRPFDYDTMSDVILHLHYTARDGGARLKAKAVEALEDSLNAMVSESRSDGLSRLFSLRREFPSEWSHWANNMPADGRAQAFIWAKRQFPYWFASADTTLSVSRLDLFAVPAAGQTGPSTAAAQPKFPDLEVTAPGGNTALVPQPAPAVGRLAAARVAVSVDIEETDDDAEWKLEVKSNGDKFSKLYSDILVLVRYKVET